MAGFGFRHLFGILAAVAVTSFIISEADARVGRGGSMGSRGARTYSAPPPTTTAPSTAAPMQRSITQPNATRPSTPATTPATTGAAARPGMFGGGLLGGLAAGFIGAGLFGMLFGHGFLAGLGSFAGFLGLLLQIVLIVVVARLAYAWWQRRSQPQEAYASGPSMRDNAAATGGGMLGMGSGAAASYSAPIEIGPHDYDDFEHLLAEIQQAYSDEDLTALRALVTPEMLSYFAEDLADNASRGVINKVSNVKLLQGDLAEAWQEADTQYATVAMRYNLVDQVLDRKTEQMVEGSTSPMEALELWTFRRSPRGSWVLSAIQQT
jgi:predicted lipid-binding transport protein (Tim44 family)